MRIEDLLKCSDVLSDLSARFGELPDSPENCVIAGMHLTIAHSYVVELAKHLSDGKEPYDAMIATANGDLPLPEMAQAKLSVIQLLSAKTKE